MKLMTYNILNGGRDWLSIISKIVKQESPDYLTINEANGWSDSGNKILKNFAKETGFPYFEIALSGEYEYHVAVLSKRPFKKVIKLQPLMRACLICCFETDIGLVSIASLHLTPYKEDLRHPEIDLILEHQKQYKNRVLMGDMNSLSRHDDYDPKMIESFNEKQMKKFTTDGKFRFDAMDKIMKRNYADTALEFKKNRDCTAPTSINEYSVHSNMRLDYIFVSKSLLLHLKSYSVVKNDLTEKASDHYPVVVILEV